MGQIEFMSFFGSTLHTISFFLRKTVMDPAYPQKRYGSVFLATVQYTIQSAKLQPFAGNFMGLRRIRAVSPLPQCAQTLLREKRDAAIEDHGI